MLRTASLLMCEMYAHLEALGLRRHLILPSMVSYIAMTGLFPTQPPYVSEADIKPSAILHHDLQTF